MDRFLNTETDPNLLSPLDLAFLGDCVYELFVREKLVTEANRPSRDLHAAKVRLVNAEAQEAAIKTLLPHLTEKEAAVFRRGRNAHSHHSFEHIAQHGQGGGAFAIGAEHIGSACVTATVVADIIVKFSA